MQKIVFDAPRVTRRFRWRDTRFRQVDIDQDGGSHPSELMLSVSRVLAPLDGDQQELVDLIGNAFFMNGYQWPTFQYVQASFDQRTLDASAIIAGFPSVGSVSYRYGAVSSLAWAGNIADRDPVRLTLLGLHHYRGFLLSDAEAAVRQALKICSHFSSLRRSFKPSPLALETPIATDIDVAKMLNSERLHFLGAKQMHQIMLNEPGFLGGSSQTGTDDDFHWTWTLGRESLHYAGALTVGEYVQRVAERYYLPPSVASRFASPALLAGAIDHLDAVWRLAFANKHFFLLPGAEQTVRLGMQVATREEYGDGLVALAELLRHIQVPKGGEQAGGHAVTRLYGFLAFKLSESSMSRVRDALRTLESITFIRHGHFHVEALPKALDAYRQLGISYPIGDWAHAWGVICGHVVDAFATIREEVLPLADGDVGTH